MDFQINCERSTPLSEEQATALTRAMAEFSGNWTPLDQHARSVRTRQFKEVVLEAGATADDIVLAQRKILRSLRYFPNTAEFTTALREAKEERLIKEAAERRARRKLLERQPARAVSEAEREHVTKGFELLIAVLTASSKIPFERKVRHPEVVDEIFEDVRRHASQWRGIE